MERLAAIGRRWEGNAGFVIAAALMAFWHMMHTKVEFHTSPNIAFSPAHLWSMVDFPTTKALSVAHYLQVLTPPGLERDFQFHIDHCPTLVYCLVVGKGSHPKSS